VTGLPNDDWGEAVTAAITSAGNPPSLVDPDPGAVDKLVRLGATVFGDHRIRGHRWTVLNDPEGNEFCIAARSFTGFD
jgi:Glyoxalase-like domain